MTQVKKYSQHFDEKYAYRQNDQNAQIMRSSSVLNSTALFQSSSSDTIHTPLAQKIVFLYALNVENSHLCYCSE